MNRDESDRGAATPPRERGKPTAGIALRLLRRPAAAAPLTVFLLIVGACWLVPPFWPHDAEATHLTLGASAPMADLYELAAEEDGNADRLIDGARAARLIANGRAVLPESGDLPLAEGTRIAWIEIPPILRDRNDQPIRPAWIPPHRLPDYFAALSRRLAGGLEALPGPPAAFAAVFTVRPSALVFPAGTDELGRDLFVRVLEGGRLSIAVGLAATLVSVTIGLLYGGIAGYVGGRVDSVLMRLVDILYALPFLIFVILLMVVFPRSLLLLFLAIGAVEWLTTARIVRGEVLSLKKLPFVDAARCLGLGHGAILLRHILPNTLPPVIVYATLTVPTVILLESVLSFLGLGVQPPASSWGVLLNEGAERMRTYPWMLIAPAVVFAATLLSLNLLGDSLRDRLDPKSRR